MNKLYNYIASRYDSSFVRKKYGVSLRKFLDNGVDYRYIDDINILKMFHDIYLDVKVTFPDYDLDDIKSVSDKYLFLMNRLDEYKKYGDYNRDHFIVTHNPFIDNECINFVKQNSKLFSLDELFNYNLDNSFGGVCLISKKQTVCMYNDDSFGYIGSGYHNDSFHKIIKAIYNEKFVDESGLKYYDAWQDIRIGFSNVSQMVRVFVDVPVPINSSQLVSLKILNNEIKKYRNENIKMEVSCSIINCFDKDFSLEFDDYNDLDDVIEWAVISDSFKPFYEDKNIVGFLNGENYFNGCKNTRVKK